MILALAEKWEPYPQPAEKERYILGCYDVPDEAILLGNGQFLWHCNKPNTTHIDTLCKGSEIKFTQSFVPWPPGTGFRVGGKTGIRFLVSSSHFHHVGLNLSSGEPLLSNETGFVLHIETDSDLRTDLKSSATFRALIPNGVIAPNSVVLFDLSCKIRESIELHPVSFFLHSHGHATSISAHVVRPDGSEQTIGAASSLNPSIGMQNDVIQLVADKDLVIRKGDKVRLQCLMHNNSPDAIELG